MTVTWSWNRNEPNAARRLWQHHWSQRRARNSLARMMTRFDIAPEDLAQIAMREVASGLGILSLFGPAFGRAFSAPFDRNIAAAAVPWYLAGGAPTPIAVYQPKGAASLAASYVNLVNPGTYDAAPGVAPTLDASGWVFNGTTQYLTTGIVPSGGDWSFLARISGVYYAANAFEGVVALYDNSPGNAFYGIWARRGSANKVLYGNGANTNYLEVSPDARTAAFVLAVAGKQGYRNGSPDGAAIGAGSGSTARAVFLGAANVNGSPTNERMKGSIQAAAIWNTSTNHATWMPAVMAAVALI